MVSGCHGRSLPNFIYIFFEEQHASGCRLLTLPLESVAGRCPCLAQLTLGHFISVTWETDRQDSGGAKSNAIKAVFLVHLPSCSMASALPQEESFGAFSCFPMLRPCSLVGCCAVPAAPRRAARPIRDPLCPPLNWIFLPLLARNENVTGRREGAHSSQIKFGPPLGRAAPLFTPQQAAAAHRGMRAGIPTVPGDGKMPVLGRTREDRAPVLSPGGPQARRGMRGRALPGGGAGMLRPWLWPDAGQDAGLWARSLPFSGL